MDISRLFRRSHRLPGVREIVDSRLAGRLPLVFQLRRKNGTSLFRNGPSGCLRRQNGQKRHRHLDSRRHADGGLARQRHYPIYRVPCVPMVRRQRRPPGVVSAVRPRIGPDRHVLRHGGDYRRHLHDHRQQHEYPAHVFRRSHHGRRLFRRPLLPHVDERPPRRRHYEDRYLYELPSHGAPSSSPPLRRPISLRTAVSWSRQL